MQAFLGVLIKAVIEALPALTDMLMTKVIKPLIKKTQDSIQAAKERSKNKKKAKALKNAKTKDEINTTLDNMP